MNGPFRKGSPAPLFLAVGLAAAVFGFVAFVMQPPDCATSDFYSFWAGARLVGPQLYDVAEAESIQRSVSPAVRSKRFIRPPFYAVALWPLGLLPFRAAYVVWFALNLAAALVFIRIWSPRPESYAACAFFVPLVFSFAIGQDAPLMLLAVGAGAHLMEKKKDIAGGGLMALGAMKPHLFLFVPVVLLAQRKYRALAGMLAASAGLYLISTAVLGFAWPVAFVRAAMANEGTITPRLMGLSGILVRIGAGDRILFFLLEVAGAVLVYFWTRRANWLPSAALAIAAGVVFTPRSMVYDAALFLPLLLARCRAPILVAAGVVLATILTPAGVIAEIASAAALWVFRPPMTEPHSDAGRGERL